MPEEGKCRVDGVHRKKLGRRIANQCRMKLGTMLVRINAKTTRVTDDEPQISNAGQD